MKDLMPVITSKDGRFHDGNPATGELGTRVTAQYLNNVQDHIRDVEAELKYVLSKAGLNPNDAKTTQVYDAIIAIINANRRSASTTSKGEVQLTDSINMASSVFGASALAAKTAYDKGVEANENANQRAMQGKLGSRNLNDVTVPGIYGQGYNNRATSDRNYPENKGGTLVVHNDAGSAAHQIYTVYDSGHQYSRGQNGAKQWLNWVRIDVNDFRENGGTVNNNVTIAKNFKLTARQLASTSWLDYFSPDGHVFYTSSDRSDCTLGITPDKVTIVGDLNVNGNMMLFSDGYATGNNAISKNSVNCDGLWFDDANNIFHFQSDSNYKTAGRNGKSILEAVDFRINDDITLRNLASTLKKANVVLTGSVSGTGTIDSNGKISITTNDNLTIGLVTSTSSTGISNTTTSNGNTYLNVVETRGSTSNSVGSSTLITGSRGISVSSDTGGKLIITGPASTSAVNSTSTSYLATAAAVKTAYDKAVDAYTRAETAERNAKEASLPITGGNLTGNLIVPSIDIQSKYVNVYPKNGDYGGLRIYRTGNQGEWGSHLEALPDKRWKFWTQNGYEVYVPAKSGTLAIDHEVVHKSGDIMKWLSIENTQAWLTVKSTGKETTGLDFINWNGQYPQVTLSAVDIGGYANELRIYTTPTGSDYNSDRRLHAMTVGVNGEIWTNAYGHLHNYFVKKSDFYEMSYNQHYGGAHVWAIRFNQAGGIKRIQIHCTNMYSNGELDIYLPEEVSGIRSISVQDDGYLRYSYGVKVMSANLIKVYTPPKVTTGFYVNIVGWHDF